MPNTPAAIGRGISVAIGNAKISASQRKLAGELLAAIGKVEWAREKSLMDAVTALSGSGPAYVFLLAEAMANAGIAAGLPPALATRLGARSHHGCRSCHIVDSMRDAEKRRTCPVSFYRRALTS